MLPSGALAAIKAGTSLVTTNGATRLVVRLTSSKAVPKRKRPKGVTVVASGHRYKLNRAKGASAASVSLGSWQSVPFTGSGAGTLLALAGKKVSVVIRSGAGRTTLKTPVTASSGGNTNTGGSTGTGENTGSTNTGGSTGGSTPTDPNTRFLSMFNNSGWDRPYTADTPQKEPFEDLYNFCSSGTYYERFTNGFTGYDTQYQGTWQLQNVTTGTVSGYNVVEGLVVTTDQEGKQFQLYVDLSEQLPSTAYINKNEYTRAAPGAC